MALHTLPLILSLMGAPVHGGFVSAEGTKLKLNGADFYFAGANSYLMLSSQADAEAQLRIAKSLGVNAVRMWGFWDGEYEEGTNTDKYGRFVLQPRPGVYPEEGWRKLDYAIARAAAYNMKLIIPLMNEWPEFGGITQYLEWAGEEVPERAPSLDVYYQYEDKFKEARAKFWTCEKCKGWYRDYVAHMLNRVNTYTGVAYKDDPTIMIWEIMNEPRFGKWQDMKDSPATDVVAGWLNEQAGYIKSIDPKHLIGTGEEGFLMNPVPADSPEAGPSPDEDEINSLGRKSYPWYGGYGEGTSFEKNAKLSNIDVLSIHAWPFQWNIASEYKGKYETFIPEWIDEHMRIAEQVKKPLYLGEFGWQILRREGSGLPERDKIFKAAFDHGLTTQIAGIAYWHMTNETNPAKVTYFGEILRSDLLQTKYSDKDVPHDQLFTFDVLCPADKTTCGLVSSFSAKMTAKTQKPDAAYPCSAKEFLCLGECVDIYTDAENCGSCGHKCQPGNACSLARCLNEAPTLPGGEGGEGSAEGGAGNVPVLPPNEGGAGTVPPVPSPTDEGCSMAPASTGTSWGWALGLVAALPLLRRRRRASN